MSKLRTILCRCNDCEPRLCTYCKVHHHVHKASAYVSHHGFVFSHLAYLAVVARDFSGLRSVMEILVIGAVICEHICNDIGKES